MNIYTCTKEVYIPSNYKYLNNEYDNDIVKKYFLMVFQCHNKRRDLKFKMKYIISSNTKY